MFARITRRKYLLLGLLGGLFMFVSLLIGTAWYVVQTLTRPKRHARFSSYTISPFELRLPVENVVFASRTGDHQVNGWFLPSLGARTTILICPGFRTGKTQILATLDFVWRAGYHVLAFEYYGHGEANGSPVTLGYRELEDFLGAVDYAKQRTPGTHLGVVGYSMGAAVAIIGSARTPEIEAVVADSAFATHASVVGYHLRRALHVPASPLLWIADRLMHHLGETDDQHLAGADPAGSCFPIQRSSASARFVGEESRLLPRSCPRPAR